MSSAVEVKNLSYIISGRKILNNVTFNIEMGEYVSILGPNGAGKSTLLKCLGSIIKPNYGAISFFNKPYHKIKQKDLAKILSYVPQADARPLPFTVREFIGMGRYPYLSTFSKMGTVDNDAINQSMETAGVLEYADRMVSSLSGGERQKVFIAAALAQEAKILVLDEPTTFLDPKHNAQVNDILLRVNRENATTIISVTHDINTAAMFSSRIIALKKGELVFNGEPIEFMDASKLENLFDTKFIHLPANDRDISFVHPRVKQS